MSIFDVKFLAMEVNAKKSLNKKTIAMAVSLAL